MSTSRLLNPQLRAHGDRLLQRRKVRLCVALAVWAALTALAASGAGAALDLAPVRATAASGRSAEALEQLDRLLDRSPDDFDGRFLRGVLLVETGRTSEAERLFEALIREQPSRPEPYNNLAVIQAADGRYEEAVGTLRSSLATHSSYETAYRNLTRIYGKLAGEAYSEALGEESVEQDRAVELVLLADLAAVEAAAPEAAASRVSSATSAPSGQRSEPAPTGFSEAVQAWASAWSEQRVDDYLAAYSKSFVPPDGLSRSRWERQRRERIERPGFIRVSLAFLDTELVAEDRVRVRFIQLYESDRFQDKVTKTLEMVLEDGAWKIRSESVDG